MMWKSNMFTNNGLRYYFRIAVEITILALLLAGGAGATTITVPDDYAKIQWAIDNATAGDTIEVHSGTYYENVNVDKRLTLRGIDSPVVDASGNESAIMLAADGIRLEGFTATGAGPYPDAGIKFASNNNVLKRNNANYNDDFGIILDSSSNNMLIGNNASNNNYGIALGSSSNNTLRGNNANSNYIYGIILGSSSNNTLIGNNINSNNDFGIIPASSGNNKLLIIGSKDFDPVIGIYLWSSSNNTLSGNNASNNNYGIVLGSSSKNKIYNNIFNNTNNVLSDGSINNIWNIARKSSPNIIGGSNLGGNFWGNPRGTGFSQTCSDVNNDGFCDLPYAIDINNIDYLPLSYKTPSISFTNPTPANGAILPRNYAYINTTVKDAATAFIDWNRSLIGWWRFNNESGEKRSFFKDSSSWGNNGTCSGINCPSFTSGKFGNARKFDGINDYVDAGSSASLNITDAITIEAWINPSVAQEKCWDGISGNKGVMSKVSSPANSVNWSWKLRYGAPGGGCYLGFIFNGNPAGRWVTVKQKLTPGKWYHIVVTFNGTDIKSYLNGNLKDKNKTSAIKGYRNKLLIGNDGWANHFKGKIDEIRIHRRALSPEEIKASYNAGIYRLSKNFTGLAPGSYNYQAYAQNLAGAVNKTEKRSLTLTALMPSITVTSPNGGDSWARSTTHMIRWNYTGSPGSKVKIELLKGGVLNRTINSSTPNDGSHSWTIPATQTIGSNYKVRVTSTTNAAYTDSSNANFMISSSTPSITVVSPNGGEIWQRGTAKTITWTSSGSPGTKVKIELLKGGVLNRTINSSTPNDGSHSWTIPTTQATGSNYKVRVTSTTNSAYTDSSNNNFTIGI